RHRAGGNAPRVVLGQPVGRQDIGIVGIGNAVVGVVGALPLFRGRIILLGIEWVVDWGFHGLIVGRQRAVLGASWHKQRTLAGGDHHERRLAIQRVHARGLLRPVGCIVRWLVGGEIDMVMADPFLLGIIPPGVLLAL